ncbi:MAG: hypothetical protein Q7J48_20530 [Nocardioides sp.]|nr:hypothetical protein [Nocardioides sp.]
MSTYRASVGELSLHDPESGRNLHFERDHDLTVETKRANRGGEIAAVLLIELGIDGCETHQARLDFGHITGAYNDPEAFHYALTGDEVRALTDAIDTLTALRDELARMTTA